MSLYKVHQGDFYPSASYALETFCLLAKLLFRARCHKALSPSQVQYLPSCYHHHKTCIRKSLGISHSTMLHATAPAQTPSSFAARQASQPKSPAHLSKMSQSDSLLASAVLIVPVYDEKQHGADLLMLPIFTPEEDKKVGPSQQDRLEQRQQYPQEARQHQHQQAVSDQSSRTTTPAAPTPPPKPQLPDGCQDWDHYLSQKKSSMTLPIYLDNRTVVEDRQQIRSPELNFNHSFEDFGWRDCLSQKHKQHQPQRHNAADLRRRPSAATVGCGASLRARRLSNASTLTTMTSMTTSATAPILGSSSMSIRSSKRLSNASTLTTSTFNSVKKPRGLRRICHSRHLRTYYSEGTSLLIRAAAAGGGSLRRRGQSNNTTSTIKEQREPVDGQQQQQPQRRRRVVVNHDNDTISIKSYATSKKRLSTFSTLSMPVSLTEYSAPPPYPPPEKPLPSVPSMMKMKSAMTSEVRELQTKERTKWRELLLRGIQRMDSGRRRIHIS